MDGSAQAAHAAEARARELEGRVQELQTQCEGVQAQKNTALMEVEDLRSQLGQVRVHASGDGVLSIQA